jgi:hypothetical protein
MQKDSKTSSQQKPGVVVYTYVPIYEGGIDRRISVQASLGKNANPI